VLIPDFMQTWLEILRHDEMAMPASPTKLQRTIQQGAGKL